MIEEDQALVRRCLEGDRGAFEQLVDKYHKTVFNVAFRMLNDTDDAADVTQSVFLKAFENLATFNARFKFFSWLYKIAVNESLNYLSRRRPHDQIDEGLPAVDKSPDERYGDLERSERIQEAMMEMGLDYRVVIVLNHFQDLSYREIAYVLDIPEKRVKSRLFSARQLLKDKLLGKDL